MKTKEKQVRIIGSIDVTNSKIIYLPLKKEPFAIMVTGEKQIEIRKQTQANRIKNQLVDSKTGNKTRVGYRVEADRKVRFAKKSGTVIE